MRRAMEETQRRRQVQDAYNQEHGITPQTIIKPIKDLIETTLVAETAADYPAKKGKRKKLSKKEREALLASLMKEMKEASRQLEFERAAELRDMIVELEGVLPGKGKKGE